MFRFTLSVLQLLRTRHLFRDGVLLFIHLTVLVPSPIFPQPNPCPVTWGPTVQISNTTSSAFVPKLTVVGDTVHVIYSTGSIFYRRSTDRGKSWSAQVQLVPVDSINPQIWNRPFVASGSNLCFVWANRASPSGDERGIKIRRSTDGGTTWLEPQYVLLNQPPFLVWSVRMMATHGNTIYLAARRNVSGGYTQTFLTRSQNGGATWDSARQITSVPTEFQSWDIAASARGVHIVYEQNVQPSRREVGIFSSTDRGETWNSGQILSTIDSFAGWVPQVAADDSGNVFVCWSDAKYGSIGGFAGTVLLRRSITNGQSWLAEVRVSTLPSARFSSLSQGGNFVHVVWDDERNGFQDGTIQYRGSSDGGGAWCDEQVLGGPLRRALDASIASTKIRTYVVWSSDRSTPGDTAHVFVRSSDRITGANANTSILAPFQGGRLHQNYPNPFNSTTTISYELPISGVVSLALIDLLGRKTELIAHQHHGPGMHSYILNASDLPTGVYFILLDFEGRKGARSILLLR